MLPKSSAPGKPNLRYASGVTLRIIAYEESMHEFHAWGRRILGNWQSGKSLSPITPMFRTAEVTASPRLIVMTAPCRMLRVLAQRKTIKEKPNVGTIEW